MPIDNIVFKVNHYDQKKYLWDRIKILNNPEEARELLNELERKGDVSGIFIAGCLLMQLAKQKRYIHRFKAAGEFFYSIIKNNKLGETTLTLSEHLHKKCVMYYNECTENCNSIGESTVLDDIDCLINYDECQTIWRHRVRYFQNSGNMVDYETNERGEVDYGTYDRRSIITKLSGEDWCTNPKSGKPILPITHQK